MAGMTHGYALQVLSTAAITAILVISLNLAMGYGGMISIVHTGLLAVGGYATGILAVQLDIDPWLGILASIVVTAAAAFVITAVSLRATDMYFALITLSFGLLIVAVAQQWRSMTGGFNGLPGVPRVSIGSTPLDSQSFYFLCITALVVSYIFVRNIVRSPIGRRFQAVKESPDTAASLGYSPNMTRLLVFTLSGGLAGLAGMLYVQNLQFISPETGSMNGALTLFIALFVGGIGSLVGPLVGVAFITAVNEVLREHAVIGQLVLGSVLLVTMFIIPRGFVGMWNAINPARFLPALPALDPAEESAPASEPSTRMVTETAGSQFPRTPTAGAVLVAEDIMKSFGGIDALQNASITISSHAIHGLIGPNGAGKSTFVNCLSGFALPDSGRISLDNKPLPRTPHRVAQLGVNRVFQIPHTLDELTVIDNVLVGADAQSRVGLIASALRLPAFRRANKANRRRAIELLEPFDLARSAHLPASTLSHGQRRLLEIARAVACNPRVLILDEPATGLVQTELRTLSKVLRNMRDDGVAILVIEHNMRFVMELCGTVTVIALGKVIARGTPHEVQNDPHVKEAYLGSAHAASSKNGGEE